MTPKGSGAEGFKLFSTGRLGLALMLALFTVLVTGCPHNEYTVELQPQGDGLERTLTFSRVDGADSNGVPNFLEFPTNELASIRAWYPAGAVKADGKQFVARGTFTNVLPADVGVNGHYLRVTSSLGNAFFYLERFRGNDDLTARTAKQFAAADQLADLVLGWAKGEFGRAPGWKNLRTFLDQDFRHDLKNAALYVWAQKVSALSDTNAPAEYTARFIQYLMERGYFNAPEAVRVCQSLDSEDNLLLLQQMKQLTVAKLKISPDPLKSKTPDVLDQLASFEASWTNYLAKTAAYRDLIKKWEKARKTDPKRERPRPENVMDELFPKMLGAADNAGEPDHLLVKLSLTTPPDYSNGRWQDGQLVWDARLDASRALPVLCYAVWSQANIDFQRAHFGKVLISADKLVEYAQWESTLTGAKRTEWNAFLAGLQPSPNLKKQVEAFRFTFPAAVHPPPSPQAGQKLIAQALAPDQGSK